MSAAITAARLAGHRISELRTGNFEILYKIDKTPVTEADLESDREIRQNLSRVLPLYDIISEEGVDSVKDNSRTFWLIDPLDGTREFINNSDEFVINIALIHHGRVVIGVIHAPALDTTFLASTGNGSWIKTRNGLNPISKVGSSNDFGPLQVLLSKSHLGAEKEIAAKVWPGAEIRQIGSALKYGLIAAGNAHLTFKVGSLYGWDIAPAAIILSEAGGSLSDLRGEEIFFEPRHQKITGIVAANGLGSIERLNLIENMKNIAGKRL